MRLGSRALGGGHRAGSFLKSSAANADRCLKLDDATRPFKGLVSATVVENIRQAPPISSDDKTSWSFFCHYCCIMGVCSGRLSFSAICSLGNGRAADRGLPGGALEGTAR